MADKGSKSSASTCTKSSSSSSGSCGCDSCSSSSSESCCERKCKVSPCKVLDPQIVACQKSAAVVDIQAEFILMGDNGVAPTPPPMAAKEATPVTPVADSKTEVAAPATIDGKTAAPMDTNYPVESVNNETGIEYGVRKDYILSGNGFFIRHHYIVCPAHLVILPPSLTSVTNRWPLVDADAGANNVGSNPNARILDQMVRASRILVNVHNVNGKGCSYVYEATLVGVDGAGDIAVLKINDDCCSKWNTSCNMPSIAKCHPFFCFGSSRAARVGQVVYLLGDGVSNQYNRRLKNAVGAITSGLLSDNRYVEYSGNYAPEMVLVSAAAYTFSSGLPILDGQGRVLGMQTTDVTSVLPQFTGSDPAEGSGYTAGPSQFFMSRVIANLIKGTSRKHCNDHIETVCDSAGSYFRYVKGYLGLGYDVFDGYMYDVTRDYTSGNGGALTTPRVRLDANGKFLSSYETKIRGIRVLGLAGLNPADAAGVANGFYYVPGGSAAVPLPASLTTSSLIGVLQPGDVILKAGKASKKTKEYTLGDLEKQIAPALLTWECLPGDNLQICYIRGGNVLNNQSNAIEYSEPDTTRVCLKDFPKLLDYPWFNVNKFPLVVDSLAFPPQQLENPQLPKLNNSGDTVFQAAI